MTCSCFQTAYLIGLGALTATTMAACARTSTPIVAARKYTASSLAPQVDGFSHMGIQRGVTSELTFRGSALSGNPRLVAPFQFTAANSAVERSNATTFATRITVDPATPLGIYPVRVLTEEGLSEPFPLSVGQFPIVPEKEGAKQSVETAPLFATPVTIEGELSSDRDRDYFRFRGKKGQRFLVEPQFAQIGSRFDPQLRLHGKDVEFVEMVGQNLGYPADIPLFAVLPADGDYLIDLYHEIHDIQGGCPNYRLIMGEVPATRDVYPLGGRRGETIQVELRGGTLEGVHVIPVTLIPANGESVVRVRVTTDKLGSNGIPLDVEALLPLVVDDLPELLEPTAQGAPVLRASAPVVFNGRINPPDEDRFILDVTPGQRLRVEVAANDLGSSLFAVLRILDTRGAVLAAPTTVFVPALGPMPKYLSYDPSTEFTVPAGQTEVALVLSGHLTTARDAPHNPVGSPYRVKVVPVVPDFEISLNDAQVNVPRGSTAAIGVTVLRKEFTGPITLRVTNPPAGLSVRPGAIAEGQTVGVFTVTATADAEFGPKILEVIGESQGPGVSIRSRAKRVITFGSATTSPYKQRIEGGNSYSEIPAYLRTRIMIQPGIFATPVMAAPVILDGPTGMVTVVQGRSTTFKVTANRSKGATGSLTFRPLSLPPELSIPEATLDETAAETTIKVSTTAQHPVGMVSVVLTAKGTIAGTERFFAVPTVTLHVVHANNKE